MEPLLVLSVLLRFSRFDHRGEDEFDVYGELENFFKIVRQFVDDEDDSSPLGLAFHTVSVSCIVDEYENYDSTDLIPSELTRHSNLDELIAFTSIVNMCSSKLARVVAS
jgi:hypothetical protein